MSWEKRRGTPYYYAKEREGARLVSRYFGAGDLARFAEMMEASCREERELNDEAWRLERGAMEREDRQVDELFAAADELMEAALLAAGFHRHERHWRRKRSLPKTKQMKDTDTPEPPHKLMARLKDKKTASDEDRADFRALLRRDKERWAATANMITQARLDLVGRINSDVIGKEFMHHACEELRGELAQPDDGALEKMLIDVAVFAWLRMSLIEQEYTSKLYGEGSISLTIGLWWERRLSLAHKRFASLHEPCARAEAAATEGYQQAFYWGDQRASEWWRAGPSQYWGFAQE